MAEESPGAFGISALTHKVDELTKDSGAILRHLATLQRSINSVERAVHKMGSQIQEMDAKLENIANQETQLGVDIQTVVDFLKANVPPSPDLTAQLGKLDTISQKLIDTSASTLGNLPPTPPVPVPARRK